MCDIQDTHPLREITRLEHVSRYLSKCLRIKHKHGSGFKKLIRKCLMAELGLKIPDTE